MNFEARHPLGEVKVLKTRLRSEKGQTGTEYMLLIGVVVIAVVAAAYTFVPTFNNGVRELAFDVAEGLDTRKVRGIGMDSMSGGGNDEGMVAPANDGMSGSSLDPSNVPVAGAPVDCGVGMTCVGDNVGEADGADASDLGDIFK